MGKSLAGKELGKGITQRSDGIYQARFTNRFGKVVTLYAKTLKRIREKLRNAQYEDEHALNVVKKDVTLDEWYIVWISTYKKNCQDSTKTTYAKHYKRIQKELGYRKLTSINLIILQKVFNGLRSDNERKNSKKILVDMFERAIASDLLIKNVAKQINTVVSKEEKKERRVLRIHEEKLFLEKAVSSRYYNLFVLALETGLRIGELVGLTWDNVDLDKKVLNVTQSLCYYSRDGKYVFEMHQPKTYTSKRMVPLTAKACEALKRQKMQRKKIVSINKNVYGEYGDLIFLTKNNRPTQQFIVQEAITGIVKKIKIEHPEYEKVTPHCFRHTFATRAIENGVPPKTLQRLMGHASLQMTMDRYCHVTDESIYDAMKLMEQKRAG